ncbi:MAG: queuosine salvage family protein [Nanoarchaeota archaeon]|nr:queuosine salvage family protein [Nanoarchaeota archaeon]MBU1030742.1 queuosine salvage family protein [Nanoarchaeota archaeon]MBU1849919.1 queuosine salvage family protein [Nanoarchaeota archaeon]
MNKSILEGIQYVVRNSKNVRINEEKIVEMANNYQDTKIHWMNYLPVDLTNLNKKERLNFLFIFNSISFCYWGDSKWSVGYDRGTWNMIASIKRAIDEGKPILNPDYLTNMKEEELEDILRGTNKIPLLKKRLSILNELGTNIIDKYEGNFEKLTYSEKQAPTLVERIVSDFQSFNDYSYYNNEKIVFNKRAQLLVSDIHANGYGKLENIDSLTACADYILPMVLQHKGVLNYSKKLATKIKNKLLILANSTEEIEIRSNTIYAVELIKKELLKKNKSVSSMQINDYLWISGKDVPETQPYHRTITSAY